MLLSCARRRLYLQHIFIGKFAPAEAPSEAAADMQEPAAEPPQDKKIASTGDADTPAAATKPTVAAQEHKADQAAPKTMEQKTFAAKPDASAARAAAVAAPAPKQEKSSVAGKAAAAKPAAAAARVESEANKPSAAPYAGTALDLLSLRFLLFLSSPRARYQPVERQGMMRVY